VLTAPRDERELHERLQRIAGRQLGALAAEAGFAVPADARRAKGAVGQLLEHLLGATAGSRAEPDFPALGIELKTLPLDAQGRPRESTFVSSLDLAGVDRRWEASSVRKKLRRVCWVLVEAAPELPFAERRCGVSLVWSPSPDEERTLRRDYEDIVALLDEGARVTGARRRGAAAPPEGP
jgi:DNA mismatch repair protein MutH